MEFSSLVCGLQVVVEPWVCCMATSVLFMIHIVEGGSESFIVGVSNSMFVVGVG